MKNNKGFSALELIVSFSLTMVIIIILFEIIIFMKELYEKSITQTELLNRQNLITDYMYTDLTTNSVTNISVCGENCISFLYQDGQVKLLKWDITSGTLTYGDYTVALIKNSKFDETLNLIDYSNFSLTGARICYENGNFESKINSYILIKIPIINTVYPDDDFGLNIFYTYNSNDLVINLPISNNC